MVEGTTMTFTGGIQLAHNRVQHTHRQAGSQKYANCRSKNTRFHHTNVYNFSIHITVIAYCKRFISTCRNPKANRQSTILYTRCWPEFDLLWEDGTKNFS